MKVASVVVPASIPKPRSTRLLPLGMFVIVMVAHALYIRHAAAMPTDGFADSGIMDDTGFWTSLSPYFQSQDNYLGFSYALGAAFAGWAVLQFLQTRRAVMAAGALGSLTLLGSLMAGGCFLLGCCGSPMLGVYLTLFGTKALGLGKPFMALVTLISVGYGYYNLTRRFAKVDCGDKCCKVPTNSNARLTSKH